MNVTFEQEVMIETRHSIQGGNACLSNLRVINAILHVAENGRKLRCLPKRLGNWHSIYVCMNRWALHGVLESALEQLQLQRSVRIRIAAFSRTALRVDEGNSLFRIIVAI